MKTTFPVILSALFLFVLATFSGCNNPNRSDSTQESSKQGTDAVTEGQSQDFDENGHPRDTLYSCRQHPEVVEKETGECPECGAGLIVME